MKMFLVLSEFILPFSVFYIVIYGYFHKTDVYGVFLKGTVKGFGIVKDLAPTMIALLVSVGIFRTCGALDLLCDALKPAGVFLHIPIEVIPVLVVRCFSSSAATGLVLDLFKEYGPDSETGLMASIMMSCTETILYTVTVYYMSVHIRKTRWTLPGALFATAAGALASVWITHWMK